MNFANQLTFLRILMLPFLIIFMHMDNFWTRICALIIFILASLTDLYDGRIARKYKTITTLGIFLDPLADKLIISAALISFVSLRELNIPAWMVILIISREYVITGLRSIAATKNVIISASKSGKFKTTSQIVSIIVVMLIMIVNSALWRYKGIHAIDLYDSGSKSFWVWFLVKIPFLFIFITTILTLISGFSYLYRHKDLLKE